MKIFISGDNQQGDFARGLQNQLQEWNHRVLTIKDIPVDNNRVLSGGAFNHFQDVDIVLGLVSTQSLSNPAVQQVWEWVYVHQYTHRTRLLLLQIDESPLPQNLDTVHTLNYHALGKEAAVKKLQLSLEQPDTHIPIPAPDAHEAYIASLYRNIVREMNFLVISADESESAQEMPRTYYDVANPDTEITDFSASFASHSNRAFLIGAPGVGKTITLLQQARQAVLNRIRDKSAPLPIIGYVATWKAIENMPLHGWLAKNSRVENDAFKEELKKGNCLLLFDGVDELGSSRKDRKHAPEGFDPRQRFLENVAELPDTHQILITCRSESYEKIPEEHRLNGTIVLNQLRDEQIKSYLPTTCRDEMWSEIQQNLPLREALRLPLLLSIFTYTYHQNVSSIEKLSGLKGGALREAIFDRYLMKRYKHMVDVYDEKESPTPFKLGEVYNMLGTVGKHSAIKYGTGEVAFVTPDDKRFGYWITVEGLSFGFFGEGNVLADEFVQFAADLHIVNVRPSGTCLFTHRLLRNYFVFKYCVPLTPRIDAYAVEALSKIDDDRVPEILLEIANGDYSESIKRLARILHDQLATSAPIP